MLPTHPKSTKVSTTEFYNWRHYQHGQKKCHCGEFASIGFQYRLGMLELLCFKHYQERISECHTEKEPTEAKSEDQKNQLNLL